MECPEATEEMICSWIKHFPVSGGFDIFSMPEVIFPHYEFQSAFSSKSLNFTLLTSVRMVYKFILPELLIRNLVIAQLQRKFPGFLILKYIINRRPVRGGENSTIRNSHFCSWEIIGIAIWRKRIFSITQLEFCQEYSTQILVWMWIFTNKIKWEYSQMMERIEMLVGIFPLNRLWIKRDVIRRMQ